MRRILPPSLAIYLIHTIHMVGEVRMGAASIADTLSVKIHIGGVDGNEAVSSVSSLLPPGLLPDASQAAIHYL